MAGKIRAPAVAGLFYPGSPGALTSTLDRLLGATRVFHLGDIGALVVPHAGYTYSGPVAAVAYAQLRGRSFRRVIILAPSHYAYFEGVAVSAAEAFATPLGSVPVDEAARLLVATPPFFSEKPVPAELPGWAHSAVWPRTTAELPHRWEHSIEVQLPFLQRVLTDFRIIPALFGSVRAKEAAQALLPFVDEQTLIIASSDFSHYLPHEEAVEEDRKSLAAIQQMDVDAVERIDACGRLPIATVVHLARWLGWSPHVLEYKTSGDTSGDYSAVVGYAAVAFCTSPANAGDRQESTTSQASLAAGRASQATEVPRERNDSGEGQAGEVKGGSIWGLSAEERSLLLQLARQAVEAAARGLPPPSPREEGLPEKLRRPGACFVTLKVHGQLRGCIGTISPKEPLYLAVIRRAQSAATSDPRFPPVTPEEMGDLRIEISLLGEPRPLFGRTPGEILTQIEPARHGVVLRVGASHATFLPQVWEHFPDKIQFMERLSTKAGLSPEGWRWPGAEISVYEVESFSEEDESAVAGG